VIDVIEEEEVDEQEVEENASSYLAFSTRNLTR
jgi:hypothetical protein